MLRLDASHLSEPVSPWLVRVSSGQSSVVEERLRAVTVGIDRAFFTMLEGKNCASLDAFYGEISSALMFPSYFGKNFQALLDCLADLSWIEPAPHAFVTLVRQAEFFLCDEAESELEVVLKNMNLAAKEWSEPIKRGEWWDRDAVAFHIVFDLQTDSRRPLRGLPVLDL
jgi:RNAse (barnase) inhibitor barstar